MRKIIETVFNGQGIYECVVCGNPGIWQEKKLALQLDHIDGDAKNNNLDNVRWLCPNCHSQTDNWGVKNMKKDLVSVV